jgi:hypothetical protein
VELGRPLGFEIASIFTILLGFTLHIKQGNKVYEYGSIVAR